MTDQHGTAAAAGLVLVAAGQGTRLGAGMPKALVTLGRPPHEAPIVVHALRAVLRCRALTSVVVVAPQDPVGMAQLTSALERAFPALLDRAHGVHASDPDRAHGVHASDPDRAHGVHASGPVTSLTVVPGGDERVDSVAAGLRALSPDVEVVLVHDAARALVPVEVFDRVVQAVRAGHDAVTPALPVTDTVKEVRLGPGGVETVVATLDRSVLRAVQTPQGFRRATLEKAHAHFARAASAPSASRSVRSTDDCGLVEATGGRVTVVAGSPRALKITTPHDLELAAAWLAEHAAPGPDHTGPDHARPAVVVLSGPPGVGKTTLARELCRRLRAVHLRVDTVEQGLLRGGLHPEELLAQGYAATYAVAEDQLRVGLPVVADMVNGVVEARREWESVAARAGARLVRVLVGCSDPEEHRRRVETRRPDIGGHRLPDWQEASTREVAPWPDAEVRVDTAVDDLDTIVTRIEEALR